MSFDHSVIMGEQVYKFSVYPQFSSLLPQFFMLAPIGPRGTRNQARAPA